MRYTFKNKSISARNHLKKKTLDKLNLVFFFKLNDVSFDKIIIIITSLNNDYYLNHQT